MPAANRPSERVPAPETAGERLDSWKEIAVYLNREVRTVQRWEKTESLPIHRLPHDKRGSVFAFRGELDDWMAERERLALDQPASHAGQPKLLSWTHPETAAENW